MIHRSSIRTFILHTRGLKRSIMMIEHCLKHIITLSVKCVVILIGDKDNVKDVFAAAAAAKMSVPLNILLLWCIKK